MAGDQELCHLRKGKGVLLPPLERRSNDIKMNEIQGILLDRARRRFKGADHASPNGIGCFETMAKAYIAMTNLVYNMYRAAHPHQHHAGWNRK